MTTFKMTFKILMLLILSLSPVYAQQGVVITMNDTRGGQTTQSRMHMDKTHVRAEIRDQGQEMAVIYDSTAQVMRMINAGNRTYSEITQRDLQQIGGALAQMQEQLRNLPPEQRKMMEEMMKGRGGIPGMPGMPGAAAALARIRYKQTGSGKVGQWSCTTYDGFRGAEKVTEICAAESGFDLTPADFQVVQQLADFLKSIAPQQMEQLATYGRVDDQGFAGFPIRRVTFRNGKPESTSELIELRREAIPASTFAVPEGFRKQEMGMRMGR